MLSDVTIAGPDSVLSTKSCCFGVALVHNSRQVIEIKIVDAVPRRV